jgi:hypothetical protein
LKIWRSQDRAKLILLAAIVFLLIRNVPLCLFLPLWTHGDEIGHFDYILKLGRGHLPQPMDLIESQLFLLHKVHYDSRYMTSSKVSIENHESLGLGQYSYEAHQPPLPYLLLNLIRKGLLILKPSLLLQLKLLRIFTLLAATLGLFFIYLGLKAAKIHQTYFYIPLLFIPLLVKDMFLSLNSDCFSFLFGSMVIAGAIRLFYEPDSVRNWLWLSAGTVLALWTKIPNAFLLLFWPVLLFFLRKKFPDRKILKSFFICFLIVLVLSSPWYVFNFIRFSNPFVYLEDLPFPRIDTPQLSLSSVNFFISGFFITLFRGELIWDGIHFQILRGPEAKIFLSLIPILFFSLGFLCLFFPIDRQNVFLLRFLLLGAVVSLCAFCFAYFKVGNTPFYLARYSYAALYLNMFVFTAGWKRISPKKDFVFIFPLAALLLYNAIFSYAYLSKVF